MIIKLRNIIFHKEKRKRRVSIFGGLLLSFAIVEGYFLHYQNRLANSFWEFILHLFVIFVGALFTIPTMALFFRLLEKVGERYCIKKELTERKEKRKRIFFLSWILVFLSWMPIFLTNWPGNFIFDAKYQIIEVLTNGYHTHHPLVHTYLMGLFYRWGMSFGNVSLGFSFFILLQMLLLSFSIACLMTYFYRIKAPKGVIIAFLLFYVLVPVHAVFSITATKDVFFASFFLLYMLYIFRYFRDKELFAVQQWMGFILVGICMCLFRNNAIFALFAMLPFYFIFVKGKINKIKILVSIAAIFLGFILTNYLVGNALHAYSNDAVKESFSVPLQQLARVANYRVDDLDLDLYHEICTYIPEENIEAYNPYLSDPVKSGADERMLQDNMKAFLSLWARVGVRFPGEYVASFMSNTMGFWYPGPTAYAVSEEIATYHTLIGMGEEIEKMDYMPWIGELYRYLFADMNYRSIAILNLFFKPVFYFWSLLLAILYSIYQNKKGNMIAIGLAITYFLTLFLGPIVTLRYIYCIIVCFPLIILLFFDIKNDSMLENVV